MIFSRRERGQVAVLAVLLTTLFVLLAAGLVDAYTLLEARNWGYQAAQQAAMAGVSQGRDWAGLDTPLCTGGPTPIQLDWALAQSVATDYLWAEMRDRGIYSYSADIRILPTYNGGTEDGYPPIPVRLGAGRSNWSMYQPSVGVYLSFNTRMFLTSFIGRSTAQIQVFASASVHQPEGACTP
jgi:hypothetical protein